jgi:hypothetical protein
LFHGIADGHALRALINLCIGGSAAHTQYFGLEALLRSMLVRDPGTYVNDFILNEL